MALAPQYGEHHYYAVLGGREVVVAAEPLGGKTRLLVQPPVEYDIYQLAAEALARHRGSSAHLSPLHHHYTDHAMHAQQPQAVQLQHGGTSANMHSSQLAMPIMHGQCRTAATTAAAIAAVASATAVQRRPSTSSHAAIATATAPPPWTQAHAKQRVSKCVSPKALCSKLKKLRAAVSALEDQTATTKSSSKVKRPASSPACATKKRTCKAKVKPPWVSVLPEDNVEAQQPPAANPVSLPAPQSAPRVSAASMDNTACFQYAAKWAQPPQSWPLRRDQQAKAPADDVPCTHGSSSPNPRPWLHGHAPILFPPLDLAAQQEREEQAAMPRPGTAASCAMCASVSSRPASPALAPGMAREVLLLSGRNSPVRQALAACLEDARRSVSTTQQIDQHSHMDLAMLQQTKLRATLQALQYAGQEIEQQLRALSIGPQGSSCPATCSPQQHNACKAWPQRTSSILGQEAACSAPQRAPSNAGRLFWKP